MRNIHLLVWIVFGMLFFIQCNQTKTITNEHTSIGKKNEISIVVETELWNSSIGDSIRKQVLKSSFAFLETEPCFDLVHYTPRLFKEEAKKSRNILYISSDTSIDTFEYKKNKYASPQNYFLISATSTEKLNELISKNADSIIKVYKETEIEQEKHSLKDRGVHSQKNFETLFGINMTLPLDYHLAMYSEEPFLWYQKTLPSGDVNIIIYEVSFLDLKNNQSIEEIFLQAHDSIGKNFVRGVKENTYLKTSELIKIKKSTYDEDILDVYRIRGTWQMENDILKGMFISYVFRDDYYNRFLIVEGIINAPNKPHRDFVIEMDAIFQSVDFYKSNMPF
ncbi:DUF4837 family protein [Capnocytophaga sp. ARDL2]|uniref:DUF4837 family protein n=1 Tax=Capnocytophaga sp. ARDL2 TaxID=3238809 RepID=UPI003556F0E4